MKYNCELTNECATERLMHIPKGAEVNMKDTSSYDSTLLIIMEKTSFSLTYSELIMDGGTLIIQHDARIDVECINANGTIVIDVTEVEEYQLDTTFLYYTCGFSSNLQVTAMGRECSVTTVLSERSGRQVFSASLTCPDNSLAKGMCHDI